MAHGSISAVRIESMPSSDEEETTRGTIGGDDLVEPGYCTTSSDIGKWVFVLNYRPSTLIQQVVFNKYVVCSTH